MSIRFALGLIAGLLLLSGCSSKMPDQTKQKAFPDPNKAVQSLIAAVKADDDVAPGAAGGMFALLREDAEVVAVERPDFVLVGEVVSGLFWARKTPDAKPSPLGDLAAQAESEGEMKQGFAMIAYPADYGSSGIMTFIVNQDGAIYETDLGEDTLKAAGETKEFNPDDQWSLVK